MRIEKDYSFETDDGNASLADLSRGRSQLLLYHFVFGPDYSDSTTPRHQVDRRRFDASHASQPFRPMRMRGLEPP